jgi:uridine kinase
LRRIVRDRFFRGFSAAETIERWPSVRRGEELYIFPFQERADAMFNSTLVYETSILRTLAWRFLLEVPRNHPSRVRAYELLKFLELFIPVFSEAIPANSVLREFIGGSGFGH